MKFYHTSGTRFKPGDAIGGPGKTVYMNTQPIPHGTIWNMVKQGYKSYYDSYPEGYTQTGKLPVGFKKAKPGQQVWVYEVKPFKPPIYNPGGDEYYSYNVFVEIVRVVGSAQGILQNHIRKFGDTARAYFLVVKQRRMNLLFDDLYLPKYVVF